MPIKILYVFQPIKWERDFTESVDAKKNGGKKIKQYGSPYYENYGTGDFTKVLSQVELHAKFPKADRLDGYDETSAIQYLNQYGVKITSNNGTEGTTALSFKVKVLFEKDAKVDNPASFSRVNIIDVLSVGFGIENQRLLSSPKKEEYSKLYDKKFAECKKPELSEEKACITALMGLCREYFGMIFSFKIYEKKVEGLFTILEENIGKCAPDFNAISSELIFCQMKMTQAILASASDFWATKKEEYAAILEVAAERIVPFIVKELTPIMSKVAVVAQAAVPIAAQRPNHSNAITTKVVRKEDFFKSSRNDDKDDSTVSSSGELPKYFLDNLIDFTTPCTFKIR